LDTASQQRILGYFIEEAKEHLQTLEQGILELEAACQDEERVNEMFRAAHSVKGGAAMLGYSSIQKAAHRLEDSFKLLKENTVPVDQKLESLFLNSYDLLQDLVTRLENSAEFKDEDAEEALKDSEANFQLLNDYLNELLSGSSGVGKSAADLPTVSAGAQVKKVLAQMLELFKQPDSDQNRQNIFKVCQSLTKIEPGSASWQQLVNLAATATKNRKYPYKTVAQVIIKEVKQAGDLLDANQGERIVPSKNIQQLAATVGVISQSESFSVPKDIKGAAIALLKNFNRSDLTQLVKVLAHQLRSK